MACVLSFILISLVALIHPFFAIVSLPNTAIVNSAIAIIMGTFLSIVMSMVFNAKWFTKVMVRVFHKTQNTNIWKDILDLQNGSNLKVYLKDKDYYVIGHFRNMEEKDEPWIALSAFGKFDVETNENYKEEPSYLNDTSILYTVRLADVEHIEVF